MNVFIFVLIIMNVFMTCYSGEEEPHAGGFAVHAIEQKSIQLAVYLLQQLLHIQRYMHRIKVKTEHHR